MAFVGYSCFCSLKSVSNQCFFGNVVVLRVDCLYVLAPPDLLIIVFRRVSTFLARHFEFQISFVWLHFPLLFR